MYTRSVFREIRKIIPPTVVSSTAEVLSAIMSSDLTLNSSSILGQKFDLTVECTTGSVTLGFSTTLTSTKGITLSENSIIDLKVDSALYLCSASTAARFQAIVWK